MQIEQPNSNKHGKSEMTASKRFQIFRRNRLVVLMLTIIDDYRRCSGKNNDDNKTVPNNLPECHNNRKIQLIWTKIPIIPHYCNSMKEGRVIRTDAQLPLASERPQENRTGPIENCGLLKTSF